MIGQWTSWTDWSDCFVNPLDKYMSVSSRTRSCLCENCTIFCNGPTFERKKCADIGHCRRLDANVSPVLTSCVTQWQSITKTCVCPPLEICIWVKRPLIYASLGGELKISVDGTEIGTYPDGTTKVENYCPDSGTVSENSLVTFDAVQNDQVCLNRFLTVL